MRQLIEDLARDQKLPAELAVIEDLARHQRRLAELAPLVPRELECVAEETVADGRLDLRFRDGDWDVIVEVKIHAGYGPGWFERYLNALSHRPHAYLAALTRDVPIGEPPLSTNERWLGATRWRTMLPRIRRLGVADEHLQQQWSLFFDVLELEGSMGFTKPDPILFDAFAAARLATRHMEEFLRVLEAPLLIALQETMGQGITGAGSYWKREGRFSRAKWGKLDIPFRIPADGPWRVRAGLIGWQPPTSFYVQPAPSQRWDTRQLSRAASASVAALVAKNWDPRWLRKYLDLKAPVIESGALEEFVLKWARSCFEELRASGLLALPLESLGPQTDPDEDIEGELS